MLRVSLLRIAFRSAGVQKQRFASLTNSLVSLHTLNSKKDWESVLGLACNKDVQHFTVSSFSKKTPLFSHEKSALAAIFNSVGKCDKDNFSESYIRSFLTSGYDEFQLIAVLGADVVARLCNEIHNTSTDQDSISSAIDDSTIASNLMLLKLRPPVPREYLLAGHMHTYIRGLGENNLGLLKQAFTSILTHIPDGIAASTITRILIIQLMAAKREISLGSEENGSCSSFMAGQLVAAAFQQVHERHGSSAAQMLLQEIQKSADLLSKDSFTPLTFTDMLRTTLSARSSAVAHSTTRTSFDEDVKSTIFTLLKLAGSDSEHDLHLRGALILQLAEEGFYCQAVDLAEKLSQEGRWIGTETLTKMIRLETDLLHRAGSSRCLRIAQEEHRREVLLPSSGKIATKGPSGDMFNAVLLNIEKFYKSDPEKYRESAVRQLLLLFDMVTKNSYNVPNVMSVLIPLAQLGSLASSALVVDRVVKHAFKIGQLAESQRTGADGSECQFSWQLPQQHSPLLHDPDFVCHANEVRYVVVNALTELVAEERQARESAEKKKNEALASSAYDLDNVVESKIAQADIFTLLPTQPSMVEMQMLFTSLFSVALRINNRALAIQNFETMLSSGVPPTESMARDAISVFSYWNDYGLMIEVMSSLEDAVGSQNALNFTKEILLSMLDQDRILDSIHVLKYFIALNLRCRELSVDSTGADDSCALQTGLTMDSQDVLYATLHSLLRHLTLIFDGSAPADEGRVLADQQAAMEALTAVTTAALDAYDSAWSEVEQAGARRQIVLVHLWLQQMRRDYPTQGAQLLKELRAVAVAATPAVGTDHPSEKDTSEKDTSAPSLLHRVEAIVAQQPIPPSNGSAAAATYYAVLKQEQPFRAPYLTGNARFEVHPYEAMGSMHCDIDNESDYLGNY